MRRKKAEILQLLMLEPKIAILDETDSGLDVDAVKTVSKGIEAYQKRLVVHFSLLHTAQKILSALSVDKTHVLVNGSLVADGDASLIDEINDNGFAKIRKLM